MSKLTLADQLSILTEIRTRLQDPANWGSGIDGMIRAPYCILGHALDITCTEKISPTNGGGNYDAFETDGEMHELAATLARHAPLDYGGDELYKCFTINDALKAFQVEYGTGHGKMLVWISAAIADVEEQLGATDLAHINPSPRLQTAAELMIHPTT